MVAVVEVVTDEWGHACDSEPPAGAVAPPKSARPQTNQKPLALVMGRDVARDAGRQPGSSAQQLQQELVLAHQRDSRLFGRQRVLRVHTVASAGIQQSKLSCVLTAHAPPAHPNPHMRHPPTCSELKSCTVSRSVAPLSASPCSSTASPTRNSSVS